MPLDPITAAIVSSAIGAAVQGLTTPAPVVPPAGMVRNLPFEAKTGFMQPPREGHVVIDGRLFPLSPGVVIRNEQNYVVPPHLIDRQATVRYLTDSIGAVHRVWMLSAAEAALAVNR